jgi:hypothetical protein
LVRTLRELFRKLGVLGATVPVAAIFPFRSRVMRITFESAEE